MYSKCSGYNTRLCTHRSFQMATVLRASYVSIFLLSHTCCFTGILWLAAPL